MENNVVGLCHPELGYLCEYHGGNFVFLSQQEFMVMIKEEPSLKKFKYKTILDLSPSGVKRLLVDLIKCRISEEDIEATLGLDALGECEVVVYE